MTKTIHVIMRLTQLIQSEILLHTTLTTASSVRPSVFGIHNNVYLTKYCETISYSESISRGAYKLGAVCVLMLTGMEVE